MGISKEITRTLFLAVMDMTRGHAIGQLFARRVNKEIAARFWRNSISDPIGGASLFQFNQNSMIPDCD